MGEIDLRLVERIVGYIKDQISYENDGRLEDVLEELRQVGLALETYGCDVFIDEVGYQVKTMCDKNGMCPDCFCDLSVAYEEEVHSYLDDKPVELLAYHVCEECGWDSNMD